MTHRLPRAFLCMLLLLLLLAHSVKGRSSNARPSGFYTDNGRDQTLIDYQLSAREVELVKENFLQFFGLKSAPRRKRVATDSDLRNSNSKFLIDIYRGLVERENSRKARALDSSLDLDATERRAIDESDTIIALANHNDQVASVRHERGQRMWFNCSDVPADSELVGAKLRLGKKPIESNATFVLSVYKVINIVDGERDLEFVDSVNVSGLHSGWIEVNMTDPLTKWVAFRESNKGLYLSVYQADKPGKEIRPDDIGIVTANIQSDNQPFVVAFMKTVSLPKITIARTKRQTLPESTPYDPRDFFQNRYGIESPTEEPLTCRLRNFYINFKDMNWQDWIIAPEGYNAYYCSGVCKFPLNSHMNATNHAIIQTLVNLAHPNLYPRPCCVPTRYLPVSVLYFVEDSVQSNVVLKKYKKMTAKSCGCH